MNKLIIFLAAGVLILSGLETIADFPYKTTTDSSINKGETSYINSDKQILQTQAEYEHRCILVKFVEGIDVSTPQKVFQRIGTIVNSNPNFGRVLSAEQVFSGFGINFEKKYHQYFQM